jgi:putative transposase
MANTYTALRYHIVFSTKNREPWLLPAVESRIWEYIGGVAREHRMQSIITGGYRDHVHIIVSIPPSLAVAKAVQILKGSSSRWIHQTFPDMAAFAWQDGYGAFSVGLSQMNDTVNYIRNQQDHHHGKTFQEEYLAFLRKHEIEYDNRYVWG